MHRRTFSAENLLASALITIFLVISASTSAFAQHPLKNEVIERCDVVVIYGATPGGIAAALRAAQMGHDTLLIEPSSRIGGLFTNGLSHTDFRTFEGFTGTFWQITQHVMAHYREKYGPDSAQLKDSFRGTHAEPHVNLLVLNKMLAAHKNLSVLRNHRLISVISETQDEQQIIVRLLLASNVNGTEVRLSVSGMMFIDGTYEGDLMAKAGVKFSVGRESKATYNESLAPDKADDQVQGYNFRLIMTTDASNRVMPAKPKGYNRDDFAPLLPMLKAGKFKSVFAYPSGCIYKAHKPKLPNGKYDINDVSHGLVRLSIPQINNAWPNGDPATRQRIFDEHVNHNMGMLYFLQNDNAVPAKFRDEARQWGWCKDEFQDNGHVPHQLYVREARRMIGMHVFTEQDTDQQENDARSVFHADAIAMGDYGPNCHGTDHEGPRIGGKHTGEFYKKVSPYQIPYGTIVPKNINNLLVPVAASSSHVGYCALRLEPIWTALGDAAGFAAHVAMKNKTSVQQADVKQIQRLLHNHQCATIYTSDIAPDSKRFAAVQWWSSVGGLQRLNPAPKTPGQRGEHILGQYFKAYPGHAVEMDKSLDDATKKRWLRITDSLGIKRRTVEESRTRGEFIHAAFDAAAD